MLKFETFSVFLLVGVVLFVAIFFETWGGFMTLGKKKWAVCSAFITVLCLMGISSVWGFGYGELAEYYYGNNSLISVLGESLDTPDLSLNGATIDVDTTGLEEFDRIGYGVFMEYDENRADLVDATIDLTASSLSFGVDSDENHFTLSGIEVDSFDEVHIALNEGALVDVDLSSTQTANGAGITVSHTSAPSTAAVTLDGGSSVQVSVIADNAADNTVVSTDAEGYGVVLEDDVHDRLTLDNGSSIVVDVTASVVGESVSSSAKGYGVYSDYADVVEIALGNESSIQVLATAEVGDEVVDGNADATSQGIYLDPASEDSEVSLTMEAGSSLSSEAVSEEGYAKAYALEVDDSAICQLDINDSELTVNAVALDDANAFGPKFYGHSDVTANLTNSEIDVDATSREEDADARGFQTGGYSDVELNLDGSTIDAAASAAQGDAETWGVRIHPGSISVVSLANESLIRAKAVALDDAEARGMDIGQEEDPASIDLDVTSYSTVEAVAQSSEGDAAARAFYSRGYVDVDIDVNNALFNANAASGSPEVAGGGAEACGFYISGGTDLDLDLAGSTVEAYAWAAGAQSQAAGISLHGYTTVNSLTLDSSLLTARAVAIDVGESIGTAYAAGLMVDGTDTVADDISLTNGSIIFARASAQTGEAISYGVLVGNYDGTPELTLNLDAQSGILADWAVYTADGVVTLNTSGVIGGRLLVTDLTSSSSGVLMAMVGSDDLLIGEDGVGYFEDEDFYFSVADRAELADGTTFLVYPSDNLGIVSEGDSTSIALLSAGEGDWALENLSLETPYDTPMIGVELTENAEGNQLIATTTFLTPEQAGLSANATAAYEAAVDGGVFTPTSSPEEWSPNVSGAFVAGMAHTLRVSNMNIGNRLGMLSGMNSGDEIAASNGMWFSARFTDAEQDRRDGVDGFDADTNALSFGFDREFDNVVLGVAYTRGNTDAKANDDSADFEMSDNLFSLYGHYDGGTWYSEAVISVGFGSVDSLRSVGSDDYAGDYDSTSYSALVESGCKISAAGWEIYPYLTLEYSSKDYDSYTETGGSLALHVRSKDYEVFTAGVGARLQKDFQRSWGIVTPEVSGQLAYDVENDRIVSTANFVGGTTSFVAKGIDPSETSWDLGAALTVASLGEQNVSLRLGYDYAGRQDFDAHSFTGKVRFEF